MSVIKPIPVPPALLEVLQYRILMPMTIPGLPRIILKVCDRHEVVLHDGTDPIYLEPYRVVRYEDSD